jgi:hypothetical protein
VDVWRGGMDGEESWQNWCQSLSFLILKVRQINIPMSVLSDKQRRQFVSYRYQNIHWRELFMDCYDVKYVSYLNNFFKFGRTITNFGRIVNKVGWIDNWANRYQ